MLKPRSIGFLIVVGALFVLAGCAAGAPMVATNPTPTVAATDFAVGAPLSTATTTVTGKPVATATVTREPTLPPAEPSPTSGPTPRPAPLPDTGSGRSQHHTYGDSGRREVALTFDAGADRGFAEAILDTLRDEGVVASFGITGHWADENPDLVTRIVAEGHMVFNHTYSHRSFTGASTSDWDEGVLTRDERIDELERTEKVIADLTGGYDTAPYWRPPYGDLDDSVMDDVEDAGYYLTLMWTCDSFGWNGASAADIVERCGANASPGDIVLLHVGSDSRDAEALPALIATLRDAGFAFVTVEQILLPAE